jgi:hypothetical protein
MINGCSSSGTAADATATREPTLPTAPSSTPDHGGHVDPDLLIPAYLGAAAFQDVAVAEAAGWASTIDTLGCFENAEEGGMGVHWLNESLLDGDLVAGQPEALVYELDDHGQITGLVAHEYIVPIDAWTAAEPPSLFGVDFHRHPTLPRWVLHTWIWKDNPTGVFQDWNPAVRLCPTGVPIFGVDRP